MRTEAASNRNDVRKSATRNKMDGSGRSIDILSYTLLGRIRVFVVAIWSLLWRICIKECLQNVRMGSFTVVIQEAAWSHFVAEEG
jgi:hypothetical protein